MDKALLASLVTGAAASTVAALVAGFFQRSKTIVDANLADRTLLQQERDAITKEAKIIRDELKAERDDLKTEVLRLETELEGREKEYSDRIAALIRSTVFWMTQTLKTHSIDEFKDYPVVDDLPLLYQK